MPIQDLRLVFFVQAGSAIAARMCELQTYHQSRIRAANLLVFLQQSGAQLRKASSRVRGNHQLVRVRSRAMRYRHSFAAPNQLSAASPKAAPAANSVFRRIPAGSAVPPFHRLDGNPISDFDFAALQRLEQRRIAAASKLMITRNREAERAQMLLKLR